MNEIHEHTPQCFHEAALPVHATSQVYSLHFYHNLIVVIPDKDMHEKVLPVLLQKVTRRMASACLKPGWGRILSGMNGDVSYRSNFSVYTFTVYFDHSL